ncbi:MAG: helix-turn-helix transcriptional regulator [Phycisphaerales bacterium]|nr:helix-turn-helix transcriptional regulator [Phycisphaerales bacterium]
MSEPACPARVVDLTHRRWCVPVLAQLHHARVSADSTGARFVGLTHRLGVGRDTLRQTLEYATAHGWVRRNPGHGHPLRPEFVLTGAGVPLAAACSRLWRAAVLSDLAEPIGRKWTLPILRVLSGGEARFGELKASLSAWGLTDRALSQSLRGLESAGLVTRRVTPEHPPVVRYALGERAGVLVRAAALL